jgi:thiol-disulfide isomerase/thioredoxin
MKQGTILLTCLLLSLSAAAREILPKGTTRQELIDRFGEPTGRIESNGALYLIFDGVRIKLKNDQLEEDNPSFIEQLEKAHGSQQKRASFEEAQKAKGLVWLRGEWIPKTEADKIIEEEKKHWFALYEPSIYFIRKQGGELINHNSLVRNSKVTVVGFYADWCGPCKQYEPHLKKLMSRYPEAHLNQVDIIQFDSATAKQYGIQSIPHVRVLDKYGRLVIPPTNDLELIEAGIQQALRQSKPTPPFEFKKESR